jgi:hypothetical protein
MRVLGQPAALIVSATLLALLALAHPLVWLQGRNAATMNAGGQIPSDPAAQYVTQLSQSQPLRAALRDHEVIGYISESEIDVRGDGSGQARYYLTQFALAPVLVELESAREQGAPDRDLIFAAFERPEQLNQFLREHARETVVSLTSGIALTRAREP